jgi:CubicO group peptidase (beta-lactamase class C family)
MRCPLIVSILLASACAAQDTARMDLAVRSFVDAKEFMGSVLVARDGDVLFSKSYGYANLEWDIPNSPSTKFRIGSITKQFTAASILLLEERGKLSTTDLLSKYLPDAPSSWSKITLFHLLTHTSGIPDIEKLPDYPTWEPFPSPVAKTVARFYDRPLEFAPGERYRYSSSAYIVLGYLIEKLSGESYEEFLQKNIFAPLGMKDSGYDSTSAIVQADTADTVPEVARNQRRARNRATPITST